MECSCTVDVDYTGDGPACHKTEIRTARKKHRCTECGKTIIPGEKYEHAWGIWDSNPQVYKTCADCKSVRDVFFNSWTYTEIWEDFRECGSDIPESCISELTHGARSKVCGLIEDSWNDE